MDRVNVYFSVFTELMEKACPKLGKVLNEHSIEVHLFLFEWIITLFSNTFPLELTTRLWD